MGILLNFDRIDLATIDQSGQSFRWKRVHEGTYLVIAGQRGALIRQEGDDRLVVEEEWFNEGEGDSPTSDQWFQYFDGDRDYRGADLDLLESDPLLEPMVAFGRGMRILRQDPLEMIITFMMSANNHIPRIRGFIEQLSLLYGPYLGTYETIEIRGFPTLETLAKLSEGDFRALGAGYRAPYFVETIGVLSTGHFYQWQSLNTQALLANLMGLKGVGRKVAECIALFGYGDWSCFPVDTWIKQACVSFLGMTPSPDKVFTKTLYERYKLHRGLVQQYMFYYKRSKGDTVG